ncbi:SDR family NAD(P)-dependent oxidoreductase [Nocardia higoensis]|uniref:SDR family NAD(P)-dependent oxidoreductase n=1 Tax=Nocardia higoensis TaxID=228599 RepID=A0ABS0D6M7_9NOCA|nr:SDR family NAD(P)-dependent oxidoreductase [Nocardia higoensis]MBF6354011.1 SDR family NAD(P)-dependent oxidoreductase [Nocardia higoensis]
MGSGERRGSGQRRGSGEPKGSAEIDAGAVLLLGGRSEMGVRVAQRLAPGRTVILAARRSGELAAESAAVREAGAAAVHTVEFDADDTTSHQALLEKIAAEHGPLGVVVLAFGILGDQARAEQDPAHAIAVVHTDYVAQLSVLTTVANLLRAQGSGRVVVFGSVAGARVRRANYVYGSAKAGLDGFACGLSDALHGSGVRLLLVRPGFVVGRMTEGMDPAPLSSTPDQVADAVVRGLRRRSEVVWVPWALQPMFFVMRLLPRFVWRRMPR